MDPITLVLVVAALAGLYFAWNMGANDVANAMATSVATGALDMRRALVAAAAWGIAGALFASGRVTEEIGHELFRDELSRTPPFSLALGVTLALVAAVAWLELASRRGWPVSSTHSVIGALVGFALAEAGASGLDGIALARIGFSWVFSPLAAGTLAFTLFVVLRQRVLLVDRPVVAARSWGPLMIAPIFVVGALVVGSHDSSPLSVRLGAATFPVALGVGAVGAIVGALLVRRLARPPADAPHALRVRRAEEVFAFLEVATTCYLAFALASNNVANVAGPLSIVFSAVMAGGEATSASAPLVVVLVTAIALVLGATTYGYNVLSTVSRQISDLSPSRAFTAEFAAATTILVASGLGIPISTTHTVVGAMLGVGLARSLGAIDGLVLRRIALGWIATGPICAAVSAMLYLLAKLAL